MTGLLPTETLGGQLEMMAWSREYHHYWENAWLTERTANNPPLPPGKLNAVPGRGVKPRPKKKEEDEILPATPSPSFSQL